MFVPVFVNRDSWVASIGPISHEAASPTDGVTALAGSPLSSSSSLRTGISGSSTAVVLLTPGSPDPIIRVELPFEEVTGLAFSPNGESLAIATAEYDGSYTYTGQLYMLDVADGQVQAVFPQERAVPCGLEGPKLSGRARVLSQTRRGSWRARGGHCQHNDTRWAPEPHVASHRMAAGEV